MTPDFRRKARIRSESLVQYCGQVGKQENCRVAVSLSAATWSSSLPVAYRLYLPQEWAEDAKRRKEAEVPKEIGFQTKPEIALDQIRAAAAANLDRGVGGGGGGAGGGVGGGVWGGGGGGGWGWGVGEVGSGGEAVGL